MMYTDVLRRRSASGRHVALLTEGVDRNIGVITSGDKPASPSSRRVPARTIPHRDGAHRHPPCHPVDGKEPAGSASESGYQRLGEPEQQLRPRRRVPDKADAGGHLYRAGAPVPIPQFPVRHQRSKGTSLDARWLRTEQ